MHRFYIWLRVVFSCSVVFALFCFGILMVKREVNRDLVFVLLSVLVQVPLAIFLGHAYDERVFMDTGYLVSSGLNPYQHYAITVFSSNPDMTGLNPIIGYPPLWSLLLGIIYRLSFNIVPNLFLYNFAIKIPVIASNVGLAYVTRAVLRHEGASSRQIQFAWLFLLFNPFTLLTTAAWGQFDTLIALLCVASLYYLNKNKVATSGLLLSLSVVLKPVALPLLPLPLLLAPTHSVRDAVRYLLVCAIVILGLWFLPFYLLGWIAPASAGQVGSFFTMAGGLTPFNLVELINDTQTLPANLTFLGYLWIPAVLVGYYLVYRHPSRSCTDLMTKALVVLLIFFLTLTWLAEPNINVVLPLALLAIPVEKFDFPYFDFLWVLPLAFMFLNTSFSSLFFLVAPNTIASMAHLDLYIRNWRLIARFAVVVVFQVFAWILIAKMLKQKDA